MDEQQPVKRKRGRPPGIHTPRKPSPGKEKITVTDSNNKSIAVVQPEVIAPSPENPEGPTVPNLIGSCLAIRDTVDIENPATMFSALEKYLTLCAMSGMKISNTMLYFACGVNKQAVYEWGHGTKRKGNPEYKRFANLAREICTAAREQYGLEGQVNPILTIFHQKFYDGFRDDPQIDESVDPLGENQDPAKLAEKYKDIIID